MELIASCKSSAVFVNAAADSQHCFCCSGVTATRVNVIRACSIALCRLCPLYMFYNRYNSKHTNYDAPADPGVLKLLVLFFHFCFTFIDDSIADKPKYQQKCSEMPLTTQSWRKISIWWCCLFFLCRGVHWNIHFLYAKRSSTICAQALAIVGQPYALELGQTWGPEVWGWCDCAHPGYAALALVYICPP